MKKPLLLLLLACCATLNAAELRVDPKGQAPDFKTVGEGMAALKPGDTLTIMPGEYCEAIQTTVSGTAEAPITIRAWRAGTAVMRGDVELAGFKPAPGLGHVFVTACKQRVESVAERSTLRMLEPKLSTSELEMTLGSYYQDGKNGLLYVHTTDSQPPEAHALCASVTNACGMVFDGAMGIRHIVVEGLVFTGFSHLDYDIQHGSRTRWGLMFKNAEHVTVRRCAAYLNSGGIHFLGGGQGCVVEDCQAFANWSRHVDIGNNINGWGVSGTTFRRNRVEGFMPESGTSKHDITFYSGGNGCVMEDNAAIHAGVMIKGGFEDAIQRGNVATGHKFYRKPDSTNLELPSTPGVKERELFADALNHDFRRQGAEAGVFFVSPSGDDAAAGTSIKQAWRTLKHAAGAAEPGRTIYILAGDYAEPLEIGRSGTADKPVRFVRHGLDRVVVRGVEIRGAYIEIEGLEVREGVHAADGAGLRIKNCLMAGAKFEGVSGLSFEHNLVRENGLSLVKSPQATVAANVLEKKEGVVVDEISRDGLWANANHFADQVDLGIGADEVLKPGSPLIGRGPLASVIGPFQRFTVKRPLPIENVVVHEVGDTTATVEWWTPTQAAQTTFEWGPDARCSSQMQPRRGTFHSVSLSGLKPGTAYFFRAVPRGLDDEMLFAPHMVDRKMAGAELASAPQSFTTLPKREAPRTLHVAVTGDDSNGGLSAQRAWRSVAHAADQVRAGDTVLIHGGTYEETVNVRSSGSAEAPITFCAAPGEVVWMDGSTRFRGTAFRLENKHCIHLDGLRFRHFRFGSGAKPIIDIEGGSGHVVRRCFHDGRELDGYVGTLVAASECEGLLVENTVMINGMNEGVSVSRCPGVTVRHCVFYNNFIRALSAWQYEPSYLVHFSHNLVCDSIPQKVNNALLRLSHLDCLRSDHNVFFTRIAGDQRRIVETADIGGKRVGHQDPATYRGENLVLAEVQKLVGQEKGTRFGNPGIAAVGELMPPKAIPSEWAKAELGRNGSEFAPLGFKDFIPAEGNPLAKAEDGSAVGLEPAAFR
ncbi:hypothetical protein [Prosthecobacter sp.]|uniref:hypothetical protein n=1 Tax=Prosthecobacter sp. TaxID=1965333 RepID=UPI0037841643